MEQRTITVKGIGSIKTKVDYIVITMSLNSEKPTYDETMALEAERLNKLTSALMDVNFKKEDIKTSNFEINPVYESEYDDRNHYKKVFKGFVCQHDLSVAFDYDFALLNQTLSAITHSLSEPILDINFTIKDQNAINEELLKKACKDARNKAEILCEASGYQLGQLLKIDYDWKEIYFASTTRMAKKAVTSCYSEDIEIQPDDVTASDSAVFVWEIR